MGMAITVQDYLDELEVSYDLTEHPHTATSIGAAVRTHVAPGQLAKGVVIKDADGVLTLSVVPSDRSVDLDRLGFALERTQRLASEGDIIEKFDDCDPGAVPPLGNAYAMRVLLDNRLTKEDDVYFESGDHEHLVHVDGKEFRRLMGGAMNGTFCRTV